MHIKQALFYVCSVCLHLAVFWPLWQATPMVHSHGADATPSAVRAPMAVRWIESAIQLPAPLPALAEPAPAMAQASRLIPVQRPVSVDAAADAGLFREQASRDNVALTLNLAAQEYFSLDRLTVPPSPLTPIELDTAEIDARAIAGSVELTLLINADGVVVDAFTATDLDHPLREFSDLVGAVFKSARFTPAEIEGRAVSARLQIMIVSEKPAVPDGQSGMLSH